MIRHYCGLFGISNHEDAARLAYFGLYAQQHRGQESAGICTWDGHELHEHRAMGLVPEVFSEEILSKRLLGHSAIGHVRYSTTGTSSLCNAQPFVVKHKGIDIALAHNGNLINTDVLRAELEERGSIFHTSHDSEVFMHLIVRALKNKSLEDAIREACEQVEGAYSLVILTENKLIALRDPYGFRPLALGKMDNSYIIVSETCALDLLDAEYIRPINPGEMIILDNGEMRSEFIKNKEELPSKPRQCIFEVIYFARPDSYIFGEQVYLCRKRMGWQLAFEATPDVDFIMPFPDSGIYSAVGFAQCSELPYEHSMIRNHYVGRTFIQPSQSMRDFGVRVKINPVKAMIENKRICIVDDSIVRGTTVMTRVSKLRELGAKEVHIRISCPPVKYPCFYGIDFASQGELVAAKHSIEEITNLLNVDSLHYLSLPGLLRSVTHSDSYCVACFTGNYPVGTFEKGKIVCSSSCMKR